MANKGVKKTRTSSKALPKDEPPCLSELQLIFLEHLTESLGIVTKAAELAKCSRRLHYQWLNGEVNPRAKDLYKAEVDEIQVMVEDVIEDALLQKVTEGDITAIIFAAKTKIRKRGYNERMDVDVTTAGEQVRSAFVLNIKPDKD